MLFFSRKLSLLICYAINKEKEKTRKTPENEHRQIFQSTLTWWLQWPSWKLEAICVGPPSSSCRSPITIAVTATFILPMQTTPRQRMRINSSKHDLKSTVQVVAVKIKSTVSLAKLLSFSSELQKNLPQKSHLISHCYQHCIY